MLPVVRFVLLLSLIGCADPRTSREARIVDTLAEDNDTWALRDPELVALKLRKMQRGPYEWLRGTAALYWRDVTEPGAPRAATAFGSPAASRVLLLGDPHVENVGTFRTTDGTMFVDWNDFDATGYGPFDVDVRRLGASLATVAALGGGDAAFARELAATAAARYAEVIGALAAGTRFGALGFGANPLFDDELDKSQARGDRRQGLDELAPVVDGVRALAFGDLEPVADDGVIEDRLVAIDAEQAAWIDDAIAAWRARTREAGAVLLRARRIGSGVSSYAAYRYAAVLAGPTAAPEDDLFLELKETREGVIVPGVPRYAFGEWSSPAQRAVDTQRRLHARPDGDARLGHAQVGGLSLKIRDRESYQRGIDAPDLVELVADDPDQLRDLAADYGELLGRAHGQALTADGVPGHTVIAPLLAGREGAFAAELAELALADAAQIQTDFELAKDVDLASLVIGRPR